MKIMMRIGSLVSAAIVLLLNGVRAQDIHFSQYDQSPFNINPALTGAFDGAYRFIGNQRSQWRSVTVPYRTTGLAVDARNPQGLPVHGGLSLFHDQAGDSRLRRTSLNLSSAVEVPLNGDRNTLVTIGAALGFTSMQMDYSQLTYDSQWNGLVYDPSIGSGESFARDGRAYMNAHLGAAFMKKWEGGRRLNAGMGLFNLSAPKQSFFDEGFVRLGQRVNIHATWIEPINAEWEIRPSMLFMSQGAYREWDIGGTAHYILSSQPFMFRAIYGGVFMRTRDAGFLVAGMRYDEWNVGLSYDINTSDLRPASAGRGGFELSVIYIIPPKPTARLLRKVCPDYI
jgi:type IX secretion system PorP/SprF family membrane protein